MENQTGGIPFSGMFTDVQIEGVPAEQLTEISIPEIQMNESLLSASLETVIQMQATIHHIPTRNWDLLKGRTVTFTVYNPNMIQHELTVAQTIYRQEDRKQFNYGNENLILNACDPTLLVNHGRRMSQYYRCETPSAVVSSALSCVNAQAPDIEESNPKRNYSADNIHPFQVIAEQADVALNGNDPSFMHYMTYINNGGQHHFKSLKALTQEDSKAQFVYNEKGFDQQLGDVTNIMAYEFPCDFDLLTDILNGLGPDGQPSATLTTINTFNGSTSLINGSIGDCGGMGGALNIEGETDTGTEDEGCGVHLEDWSAVRQARISLIQPDKIALRIIVPLRVELHAGDMIDVTFINKANPRTTGGDLNYGSGDYLIVNVNHNIKAGGYGVSIFDLVSKSVGQGIV